MRVLLDTNIILDFLLERQPFFTDADAVMQTIRSGQVQGYITATTLTDIFYIAKKSNKAQIAKQYVSDLLTTMQVCTVDRSILEAAISSSLPDFEDAVQLACAISENLNAIITRDPKGFAGATVAILSASEFVSRLSSDS
jgi:predicted nucleic acid-binding protein